MKKIINIVIVIGLVISVVLNIYLYQQIKGKQASLAATTEQISEIKGNLEELENEIINKDGEIEELGNAIGEKEESIDKLEEEKGKLESEKAELEKDISLEKSKEEQEEDSKGIATQEIGTQPSSETPVTINPNQSTDEQMRALFGDAYKGSGVGGDSHATGLGNRCE